MAERNKTERAATPKALVLHGPQGSLAKGFCSGRRNQDIEHYKLESENDPVVIELREQNRRYHAEMAERFGKPDRTDH